MTAFERAFIEEVKRIRSLLEDCAATSFVFAAQASGRIRDGDVEITFGVGEYSPSVTASTTDACLQEWMHRKGWEKRNQPLCLPKAGDIPFTDGSRPSDSF